MTVFDWIFYGNTFQDWLLALLLMVFVMILLQVGKIKVFRSLLTLAGKTENQLDDHVIKLIGKTHFLLLFALAAYAGSMVLTLPGDVSGLIGKAVMIGLLVQVALWGNETISYVISQYVKTKMGDDYAATTMITAIGFLGRLALLSVVVLLIIDNLGGKIDTLVAGLGIGGIAIALAVQNVLGDLFGSLSIVLDRPFVIGDFIIVDNYLGTVEHIGLKSTHIRSISGEQLIFSNNDLLKSRIRNYKRMRERRVVFSIGVTYQTPYEKLASIPSIILSIIEAQEQVRFDRAHFKEYGSFSLDFEIVYYVLSPDYTLYMDTQQTINLAVFHRFQEEGIEFAYPTQTLFMARVAKDLPS